MTPEVDAEFDQIARARIARDPLRYYAVLPAKRAVALWFDTHSWYYPFQGELLPLAGHDRRSHQLFWLALFVTLLWVITFLAVVGAYRLWRARGEGLWVYLLFAALVVFVRIGFLSSLEYPEPRYTVELFGFVLALGALALAGPSRRRTNASDPRTHARGSDLDVTEPHVIARGSP
jgi:hypothetical protein